MQSNYIKGNRIIIRTISLFIVALIAAGCTIQKPSSPVGIFPKEPPKVPSPDASAVQVPPGYKAEVFMKDLVWPTSIDFDESGNVYVAEAGYAYGDPFAPAQIFRVAPDGRIMRLADQFIGPITDILWHQGRLYVSHRGKISAVEANGSVEDLVIGLPSEGDHENNQITVGPDGKIYFGQGTVTNSGVVGLDNAYPYLWLMLYPNMHDVPAYDIKLRKESFLTPQPNNVLSRQGRLLSLGSNLKYAMASIFNRNREKSMLVRTGAFQPFGKSKTREIQGEVRASGAILRMNPDGTDLEVYAWGLRNPFGVMWGPDGQLYASNNGYDERGSRPIANALDDVLKIKQNGWYGFPDFSSGMPVTDKRFTPRRGPRPELLLAEHPALEPTWMTRPEHAGVAKIDFSTSDAFGFVGHLFLAEVGSGTPITGDDMEPAGHMVVRIDPDTEKSETFLSNKSLGPKGMEYVTTPGPRRLVEAKFSPDGNVLYVVDIGVIYGTPAAAGPFPMPRPGTGVIWRITREDTNTSGPPANLSPMPPKVNTK